MEKNLKTNQVMFQKTRRKNIERCLPFRQRKEIQIFERRNLRTASDFDRRYNSF